MAPVVVLVHGAWHGAWCWEQVVPGLADQGVRAVAIDLPGHGADSEPLGDLHGDAARVRAVLDDVGEPVVVVGHSYGGAVVTEAGDHPLVTHVVFIAAFALDAGESCMSAAMARAGVAGDVWERRPNLADGFVPGPRGSIALDPSIAAACFYNDCDDATAAWAVAHLGPHPLVSLEQEPTAVAWRTRPSTYAVCGDDLVVPVDLQRAHATRCASSVEWPTGHSPFLSRPELVVGLVASLASSPSAG